MSDFDSNPFADPKTINPFADPSVQQARTAPRQVGLDNYNPFPDGNKAAPVAAQAVNLPPKSSPAIMQPSYEQPPPPYTPNPAQKVDTTDLERRQQELEKKAEELERKEQEMKNLHLPERKNNWPPLPKWFPIGPCFYQDFSVDIPLEFQRTVRFIYYIWMFYAFTLFLNLLGSLAYFIVDSSGGITFGLSILWLVLFGPCSFVCWYRPLYKAFRNDSSFNFFVFFFIFFFQFITSVVMSLGFTNFSVGWINGFSMLGAHVGVGIVMLIAALFLLLSAGCSLFMLIKVHRIYRRTGASFAKAQQEFATGVMKNEAVQSGVASAASSAAQGAMQGATSQYGSGDYKY